jgi:hypothetical protein
MVMGFLRGKKAGVLKGGVESEWDGMEMRLGFIC